MKKRKVKYYGIQEPITTGFKKTEIINEVKVDDKCVKVDVNMTIRKNQFSIFAAEEKLGFKVGEFIKFIDRKCLEAMGKNKQVRVNHGRIECVRYGN